MFAPASGCSRFVFTETGDTDADSQAGTALGGFGAVFDLRSAPTSTTPTAGIARCA